MVGTEKESLPVMNKKEVEDEEGGLDGFDDEDFEDFETLPCNLKYVVICLTLPSLNGLLNGFLWPAYTNSFSKQWLACGAGRSCSSSWLFLPGIDSTDATGGWLLADSAASCYPLDICSFWASSTLTRSGLCLPRSW